jgi:RND family efflux transporter, MFP subunit
MHLRVTFKIMFKNKIQMTVKILVVGTMTLSFQSCSQPKELTISVKKESASEKEIASSSNVLVAPVTSGILNENVELPAELHAFRDVRIHSKIKGFVSWIGVDRGSRVRAGQVLLRLSAPELDAECEELKAKLVAAKAAHAEALSALQADKANNVESQAKLDSDQLTLERLRKAAREPGAIAQNEVDTEAKTLEGDKARLDASASKIAAAQSVVDARFQAIKAAANSLKSKEEMRNYLVIKSPINGVITERWVHEGDMAGVELGRSEEARPLLRLVELSKLRLVVSVPEYEVAGIRIGKQLSFSVPAYLGRQFTGEVMRIGHALDVQTRTMPVELDVNNSDGALEPGMYATVKWQVMRPYATLFVPTSAVASNLEKTFVVQVNHGVVNPVVVRTGQTMGDNIEIVGPLKEGDQVVLKATDEYKTGLRIDPQLASAHDIEAACQHHAVAAGE